MTRYFPLDIIKLNSFPHGTNSLDITWYSDVIKDVVTMAAWKGEDASFAMKVINDVVKIKNTSGADVVVAWYGAWANTRYYEGVAHMSLKDGVVTYLNFPMVTENDIIGLKTEDGTEVITPVGLGARFAARKQKDHETIT